MNIRKFTGIHPAEVGETLEMKNVHIMQTTTTKCNLQKLNSVYYKASFTAILKTGVTKCFILNRQ